MTTCPVCQWPIPSAGHTARCLTNNEAVIAITALDLLAAELGAVEITTTQTPTWRIG